MEVLPGPFLSRRNIYQRSSKGIQSSLAFEVNILLAHPSPQLPAPLLKIIIKSPKSVFQQDKYESKDVLLLEN